MAWVTMIGPADEQVEYRLTGGHGCGKTVTVDAAPLIAAVEAKAERSDLSVAALLGSREPKRSFYRARAQLRGDDGTARLTGFDAVELAVAAGLDARELYGDSALPAQSWDGQIDYHLDSTERPLMWIGGGLTEFGISSSSVLAPAQFQAARRLMRGEDPNTGKTLVEPKLAVSPAAKLPAGPLVKAARRTAAERGVKPEALLDSARKRAEFGRMERQLTRYGDSHRIPASTLVKHADAVGIDAVALYSEEALETAMTAEAGGRLDARPLLKAVRGRAADPGAEPAEVFSAVSMRRRYGQLDAEAGRRLSEVLMEVREAVAMARAAGIAPETVWDPEEVKAAMLQGRVEVGNRGADVTLDLGKSKSVLLAYAPRELAAEVEALYTECGREAIGALEEWSAYAMRGRHGDGESADRVGTSGFSGWVMVHRAARPVGEAPYGDPHFHLHVSLANMVKGEDGEWSTVAAGGRDLHRHAKATQAAMNARIRHEMGTRYGVVFRREQRTGAWEIAGIPEATLQLFSKRDSQVRQLLNELGIDYNHATLKERTAASTASKAAKNGEATGVEDDVLRAYWQAEGRTAGDDPAALINSALHHEVPVGTPSLDELCRIVFAPQDGLTSHRKDFTHAAALAAVLDALPHGIPDVGRAEKLTNAVLQHAGYAVKLNPKGPQHFTHADRYTTADVVAAEERIVSETTRRKAEQAAVVDRDTVAMTLSSVEMQHGGSFAFSDEQRAVLERLLTAGRGIDVVLGNAGSGKTTLMDAARQAWENHGMVVAGTATAAVACANLKAEAGIPSRTVASWLTSVRTGGKGLAGVDVLVVDEAAMCDDRDVAELLTHAATTGTKVVGIGDPKQLHSPGIGGHFAAVHTLVGGLELTENFRQKDLVERRALELWRDDKRMESLRTFAGAGRVHAMADKDTTLAAMLTTWADKRAAYDDGHTVVQQLLMLAATNDIVDELNIGARTLRKINGDLTGPDHSYRLAGGSELTLAVGDQVLLRHNDYRSKTTGGASEDVLNGYRGIIRAVDEQQRVLVEWREKHGDGHRDVAEWVNPDYIADGGLSLGYAITGHKSQGLSVQEALVYGPGAQANALYTMLSRDKHESHLFLPLAVYETDTDRAQHGDPTTEQEHVDRAVAGLIREIENGTEERMILTQLPDHAVPTHLRDTVADLPQHKAFGAGGKESALAAAEGDETHTTSPAPTTITGKSTPYGQLTDRGLLEEMRKAAASVRVIRRAAEAAEAKADHAEQHATAGTGQRSVALDGRHQNLTTRATAINQLQPLKSTITEHTSARDRATERLHELQRELDATGRFGRSSLRGPAREGAKAEQGRLRHCRTETVEELALLQQQLRELATTAGPENEHDQVLSAAAELEGDWPELQRAAYEEDGRLARTARAEAIGARGAVHSAIHREAALQREYERRDDLNPGPQTEGKAARAPSRQTSGSRQPYTAPYAADAAGLHLTSAEPSQERPL